jgi:ATP-dependent Clp protease adapter protein ClpS
MHLMLRVHDEAIAEWGTCSHKEPGKDDAIGLVAFAREHRHPLQCVIERKR